MHKTVSAPTSFTPKRRRARGVEPARPNRHAQAMSIACLCIGGCMVGPDYQPRAVQVADEWMDIEDPRIIGEPADHADWWTVFNDPVLNQLIQMAYEQNLTLRSTGIRIAAARYQKAIAVGEMYPQLQRASGSYSRTQTSYNGSPGAELGDDPTDLKIRSAKIPRGLLAAEALLLPSASAAIVAVPRTRASRRFDFWQLGFDMSWELDVWGQFRRAIESADANLQASIENHDSVLVTLLAEVASTYMQIRTFEERIRLTEANIEIQEQSLQIAEAQFQNGAVTELDVAQAKTLLAQTRATVPGFEAGLRAAENSLCILMGSPPYELDELLGQAPIPTAPIEVTLGIPADLLRRRPDVRRAEREVAAQSASIGVAASRLYPHFSLSGAVGLAANQSFVDLFGGKSFEFSASPGFSWDVFNYGRLINNVRVQDALFEALAVDYENTVIQAAGEVESSVYQFLKSQEEMGYLNDSVDAAQLATNISTAQYQHGATDYQRVVNSQQDLVRQQDALARSRGDIALNLIATYKALGGGWQIREGRPFMPENTQEVIEARTTWQNVLTPWDTEADAVVPENEAPLAPGIQRVLPPAYSPALEPLEDPELVLVEEARGRATDQ